MESRLVQIVTAKMNFLYRYFYNSAFTSDERGNSNLSFIKKRTLFKIFSIDHTLPTMSRRQKITTLSLIFFVNTLATSKTASLFVTFTRKTNHNILLWSQNTILEAYSRMTEG